MKKLVVFILLLIPSIVGAESLLMGTFGGLVDIIEPDLLGDQFSPDMLNVLTDEYNALTKRRGSTAYLQTALTQLQSIRSLYDYRKQNGDSYMIIESSASLYYDDGSGTATSITNSKNSAYRYTYFTAKDYLYGSNGYNAPFKSSATSYTEFTTANSTIPVALSGVFKPKYVAYWMNRAWYAGIAGQESTIWYSEYLDPQNIDAFNSIPINAQAGDEITALYVTSDNKLKAWKTFSSWEVFASGVDSDGYATFDFRNLSQSIGCLYQTTVDELNGLPIWVSHRGVELYDGSFNLISAPIDNTMKSLNQLKTSQLSLTYDTASDWGQGSGTNIDTTTYSGSVGMSMGVVDQEQISVYSAGSLVNDNNKLRQGFISPTNQQLNQVVLYTQLYPNTSSVTGNIKISIYDKSYSLLSSQDYATSTFFSSTTLQAGAISTHTLSTVVSLISGDTYYIEVSTGTGFHSDYGTQGLYMYGSDIISYYSSGTWDNNSGYGWNVRQDADAYFKIITSSISLYTTLISTAANWGQWGTFSVDDTVPSSSAISYLIKTSTANDNFASKAGVAITNGQTISNTAGNYIQVISSFTRTDASAVPLVNKITVNYSSTLTNPPVGKVFDGRYWLFVSTGIQPINDTVYCYQKTGDWTKFSNIYAGASCIFRQNFYTGSSQDAGQVFRQDIPDLYTDAGTSYLSYWSSKVYDCTVPESNKTFHDMWVSAKNTGDYTLNISYRFDGTDATWTDKSLSLTNGYGYIVTRIPFTTYEPNEGKYIQFKIGNSDSGNFRFKRLNSVYTIQPPLN